jgi:acetyl esterase
MALDPACATILEAMAGAPSFEDMTIEESRQMVMAFVPFMGEPEEVAEVIDLKVDTPDGAVPIRVYTPGGTGPFPAAVYLHGGGWATGNLDLTDPLCRMFATRAGCVVVSVDYRLAPEHPYPAALDDAYAVTAWVAKAADQLNVDGRVAVVGDSSGGNLAAAVALLARDRNGPSISLQILVYPATAGFDPDTASHAEFGQGHLITTKGFQMFWELYTGGTDPGPGSYAAPLHVPDLSRVAPAVVLTAECDPMRDEGEAYAAKLESSGVPVARKRYDGMIHGFLYMPAVVGTARDAIDDISASLRKAFART